MAAYLDLGISITAINNASRPLRQVGDDVKRVGENAQATANRLKAIQVVIAGILINKSLELGRAFAKMAADNQALDIRMTAFAGSATKAAAIQDHLSKKFAASGLIVDDLAQNFVNVRNAVQSNEQGVRLVDAMANAVLVLGGNQRNIDNLAESFQKIGGRGYASMRDLNSIIQNTPITLADLARAAGTTSTQFEQSIRMGAMNGAKLIDDFVKASEQKIGDFGQNLGATIGGATGFIKNALDDAIGDLGKRTNVNTQLAVMFTNIGQGIMNFIGSISQKDVDRFFQVLRDMEPVVKKLTVAIVNIGGAVVGLADIAMGFLRLLPQDGFDYGLLGYVFFGKKGFIIGALIGGIDQQIRNLGGTVDQFMVDHGVAPEFFANDKKKLGKSALGALADSFKPTSTTQDGANKSIFGDTKQLHEFETRLKAIGETAAKVGRSDPNGISAGLSDAIDKAKLLRQELEDLSDQTGGRINLMALRTDGDALGERVQQIKNETGGWIDALEKALTKMAQSKIHLKDEDVLIGRIKKQIEDTNNERDRAIAKETRLNEIKRTLLFLEQESTRNSLEQERVALARQSSYNPLTNLTAGLAGVQVVQGVQDKLLELQGNVDRYHSAILQLKADQENALADEGAVANMQLTIDKYGELINATERYMATIDPMEESLKGLRTELGQLFEQDLTQGISALLKGTATIGDVLRNIFSDLIDLGVKFLVQMVEIQLFGQAAAAASLAVAAPVAAAQLALWSPAAIAASIATLGAADAIGVTAYQTAMATSVLGFADGGVPSLSSFSNQVVSGPTMFGVMGEAGDEAIMPLTRIGGKLGVRAEGGGDQNHFHFHSADPESGVKFFMQHLDLIDAGLQQRRRLNHSSRMA